MLLQLTAPLTLTVPFPTQCLVGVAGGATRAALTMHQARRNNMADVSAKDGSQVNSWDWREGAGAWGMRGWGTVWECEVTRLRASGGSAGRQAGGSAGESVDRPSGVRARTLWPQVQAGHLRPCLLPLWPGVSPCPGPCPL